MKKTGWSPLWVIVSFVILAALAAVGFVYYNNTQSQAHEQVLENRTIVDMETHNIKDIREHSPGVFRGDVGEFCEVQFAYRDGGVRVSLTSFPSVGDNLKDLQLPNAFDEEGAWSVEVYDLCIYGGAKYNFQDKALQYDQ